MNTTNQLTQRQKDDILMNILKDMGITISRAAAMIMLETGMLTEERPFVDYICVKNINDALNNQNVSEKEYLKRGLSEKMYERLKKVYDKNIKNKT